MSADTSKQPIRRAFAVLFVLQGHSFEGLRLKQIAEAIGTTASTALRDLEVLADEGIVERIPGRYGFWRLSPRLIQLSVAHAEEVLRQQQRLDEFNQRYTRNPS